MADEDSYRTVPMNDPVIEEASAVEVFDREHGPSSLRPPVVGVGALLLRSDGAVLIGHRIKRGEPESWCLPGGHVEPGETFEAAARRELAEETGIRAVGDARVFAVMLCTGSAMTHVTAGVVVRATSDIHATVLEPDVFDRWTWVPAQAPPEPLFPATAALLRVWTDGSPPAGWSCYPVSSGPLCREDGQGPA